MRILQVAGGVNTIGGIEHFVQRLSRQLLEQGHHTCLITSGKPAGPLPYEVIKLDNFEDAPSLSELAVGEAKVLEAAREYRPDIVLTQTIHNPRLLLALNQAYKSVDFFHVFLCTGGKLFRRENVICTQPVGLNCLVKWYTGPCGNGRSPGDAWDSYRRSILHRDALKQLPKVLVTTDYMRTYLINEGVNASRLEVANHIMGIPPERPSPIGPIDRFNLLFVGRVTYNKGIQNAIEALKRLDDRYTLTVVGDGWYLGELKKLTDRLGLTQRVRFTGFLKGAELESEYERANIAVVPSIWPEPAALVAPEARGRGLRVVIYDVGGLGEWDSLYGYTEIYKASAVTVQALADAITAASVGAEPRINPVFKAPPRFVADILLETLNNS